MQMFTHSPLLVTHRFSYRLSQSAPKEQPLEGYAQQNCPCHDERDLP
jgi:hypothetical protein